MELTDQEKKAAQSFARLGGLKGGKARAEALTTEQRREIARTGALARWNTGIPQAEYEGEFPLGNAMISAAVLPTGQRLLTQATFLRAIGRARSPKAGTGVLSTVDGLPFFLQADVLQPFISEELRLSTTPIFFLEKSGKRAVGYDAELLPIVADVYLKMRDSYLTAGKPVPRQYSHIIRACDIVVRGLAHVGIVALVDEATGYQDVRVRNALAKILEQFIAKELQPYVTTFPLDFFKEMCRLRGIPFPSNMKLPRYFGKLVNNLTYCRLAPGALEELQHKNPAGANGRRKNKNYRWLTEHTGYQELLILLGSEITLMRDSKNWKDFEARVDAHHPRFRPLPPLPLFDQNFRQDRASQTV